MVEPFILKPEAERMFNSQNLSSLTTSLPKNYFWNHELLDCIKVYSLLVINLEMGPKAGPIEIIFPAILAMKFASHLFVFKAFFRRRNKMVIFSAGTLNSIFVVSMLKPKNSPFCEGSQMDFLYLKSCRRIPNRVL